MRGKSCFCRSSITLALATALAPLSIALAQVAPPHPLPNLTGNPTTIQNLRETGASPDKPTLRTFDNTFHTLSEQAHATILAEGRPLHRTLSDKDADALTASLTGDAKAGVAPPTVLDAIAKAAEAYDYTAERVNGHLYLLHKRYTDAHDLPCVTFEEIQNAVRQMELLCNRYGSHTALIGSYSPAELFFQSLTPEQVKKAESNIAVGELTADQQQLARTAGVELGIGRNIVYVHQTVYAFNVVKSPKTAFQYVKTQNGQVFGFSGPFGYDGHVSGRAVEKRFVADAAGFSGLKPNHPMTEAQIIAELGPDKTIPDDEDRLALRADQQDKSPYRATLGTLVEAMTRHGSSSASSPSALSIADLPNDLARANPAGVRFTVDAGLGGKVVSVYGLKYSDTDAVVRALSSLYQLTLLVPKERQYQIVLATASDRADEEFAFKVTQLIPAPMQRARDRQAALAGDDAVKNDTEKSILPPDALRQKGRSQSTDNYYYSADHRLLLLAKPLVPTPDSPPVPLAQADPEVYRMIGIMFYTSSCLRTIETLVHDSLPLYMTHPDALMIRMKYTKFIQGGGGLKAEFGSRNEAGEYHTERVQFYLHPGEAQPPTQSGQSTIAPKNR